MSVSPVSAPPVAQIQIQSPADDFNHAVDQQRALQAAAPQPHAVDQQSAVKAAAPQPHVARVLADHVGQMLKPPADAAPASTAVDQINKINQSTADMYVHVSLMIAFVTHVDSAAGALKSVAQGHG